MGYKISILLGLFSLQILLRASVGQSNAGKLGDIEFGCPNGDYFTGGYCISVIDVPMIWSEADRTCRRQGQYLMWVDDADEYKSVDHLARSSWEYYWTGLNRHGDVANNTAHWSNADKEEVNLESGLWENGQPNLNDGKCGIAKKNGKGLLGNCLRKLPFVCKTEAVLKGYFRCRNGRGIQTKFKCDGHNDCHDNSDEVDCSSTSICANLIDAQYAVGATKPSGTIVSNTFYSNKRTCSWSIVTNIGSTIKVKVEQFKTEKSADVMDFRTGGMAGEIVLGELTGNVSPLPTFYSSDNVFQMRFLTDSTIFQSNLHPGFRISWTTDVPEVFNDVQMLPATDTVKNLKSPLYDTDYLPHEKVFEWVITASSDNVVTLQFENIDIDDKGKLYLWDGDDVTLTPTLTLNTVPTQNIFISRSKSVRLMLMSESDSFTFSKGIYIKYWQGCNVNIMTNKGYIYSPGYTSGSYPDNVDCTWIIQREATETRAMSLKFLTFQVQPESDYLKIYNDTGDDSPLHSGNGYNGSDPLTDMTISSETGYIRVMFTTNYVLTSMGFSAQFSLDCPQLTVSSQTQVMYTEERVFGSMTTLTCDNGYSFVQEEFHQQPSVSMECQYGGDWDNSRVPNCMISYCPIPPSVANGYIIQSSGVKYGGNVTYKCNNGFTMVRTDNIQCKSDGTWERPPDCSADGCSAVGDLENGAHSNLESNGVDFASVVQYKCDPGYETYGNITKYCKTGGIWSHTPPTCERIFCPVPMFQHGSANQVHGVVYEMTIILTCDPGFGVNGSSARTETLECESDRKFTPFVSCMDVNECNLTSPICPASEDCHNTMGSYMCTCKPGYERLSTNADCTDINECTPNDGRGPCDQKCDNTPAAGYTCSCDMPGYILYNGDGFNNITLAKGETGMRDGDIYRIDHTCVRKQCQVPAPITNGMVLSKKDLFYYNDVIQFTCNHGYLLSGSAVTNTHCSADGTWADAIPTCTRATCTTPTMITIPRSVNIYPGESTSVPYGEVVHIECQYGSKRINRTLYCSYKDNGMYSLQGDSGKCPEINCGMPEKPPGSVYTGLTNTSLGDTFTFGCDVGFSMTGMSVDGTDNVTCQENGRWNIGYLTCTGGRCTDPGTPGGAKQMVESYEVGKLLSFKCDIDGYFPEPSEPWQCIVDTATNNNMVKWNTTDLPECMDKTPPVFTNCPGSPIYIEKTEEYSYPDPVATDNSNIVKLILNPGGYRPTGLRSNSNFKILYIAKDFSNNEAKCEIDIKIKENIPTLHCPAQSEIVLISKAEGKSVNMSDYINFTSNGNYNVTFSPAKFVTFDHNTIGVYKKIDVKAEGPWGAEDKCSFLVGTKADACFRESFPTVVANGDIVCTSGSISCTVTCDSGYIFNDGNKTKIYDCHSTNVWTPVLPVDTCIKYDEPSYIINLQVVYKSAGTVASLCVNGHKQMLINNIQIFTQEIFSICNSALLTVGEVEITKMESTTSAFSYITVFEIKLSDPTTGGAQKKICSLQLGIEAASNSTFLKYDSLVPCGSSGSTQVNRDPTSVKNKLISYGNLCTAGVKKDTDYGEKCVPCPPGTFSSAAGDTCTECPDGEFQDGFGQTTCKSCPASMPVPSADKKTCVGVCPPGFFSTTGLPPCEACPENYYWVNKTHCQMCPNSGSTVGVNAVEDKDSCKLPCDKGKYSLFGYTPCKDCPVNYYQDATKQGYCKPCASNEITQGTGATSFMQCIPLGWTPGNSGTVCCDACPGNDITCCQANCSQEISSRTCENRCNDDYNEAAECQCNSQCIAVGNCCPDYTWKCVDQTITCDTTNCTGHGTCEYKNHKRFCDCNTGYKGDNCEIELNPCDSNPCWNGGTCIKTGIDSYNCSCPVDTSCKMVRQNDKIGLDADWQKSGITPFQSENSTIEYCEDRCLKNQRCIALHYTHNYCFIYYEMSIIEDYANSVFSEKNCSNTPLFGCDRCEDDLVDSCEADTCSEHGMCQNLVSQNKATCLCPTIGVYTGDRCEQDIDLCSNPNPCQHDGKCISYGSVRYQCICPDGYTGKKCETNIDECGISPGRCLNNGTCNDGVNKYTCTCETGFSGDRCEDVPDFCEKPYPCPTGICYNNYDTFDYMCKCEDPYRNDNSGTCEMIPNCETDNCINGTCDSSNGECDCVAGFEGSLCQHNIDDCANMPCQHYGTCTDELNGYECQCPTGYDGKNCENDIDDCVGMCMDDNADGCVDRLNDNTCTCKPGYMGKNCTEDIDECLRYPCEHSGTCENQENDFTCNCAEGWTGKTCDTPMEFCNPSPCNNDGICYNLTDGYFCKCQKGTTGDTCVNFPEVCSIITPCINSGTCNDESGTAKCTCSDNYDGSSCHLINDQCNDTSTCKHSGTCVMKEMGYTCDCKDGYSDDNCLTYTDPCLSNPCHSTSACKSEETRYMCYCTHGEVLTDTGCKVTDDNFDIFVDSMIPDAHAFLRNPLVLMPNSNLTIMFWTRVMKTTEANFTLLALEPAVIGTILPLYNPLSWIGTIKNNKFILNSFVANETIPFNMDVADGKWHFIALSWELTGHTRIFIDAIKIVDKTSVGTDAFPETLQVILGLGAYGRICKLNIYKEALSDNKMIRAYENYTHLPSSQLVQGWSNIVLSESVTRIFPSSVGNEDICDIGIKQGCPPGEDRTNPTVECPADQYNTGISRFTSFTGLKAKGTYSADVTNKSYSIHTDEVYTYGSTNEVLVGYDEDRNYGICRFKVYVKYNADCPAPKTDSTIIYCSGSSGNICDLKCPAGLIPSMIHPATYSCGQLGLYDNNRPNKNFVLPTCGDEMNQALALTVKMTYKLLINCQEAVANAIREDVANMITGNVAANWPDLCKSCTPTVISKCQSGKFLDVEFTITNLGTTTNKYGVTYNMREAILTVILQENRFHFPDIASSELQDDTVIVLENPSCPTSYVVLSDTCVQCGKGTYRNDTTMSCQFCPVGKYQESRGKTSCTDCGSGKTTQTFGSYFRFDCKGDCPVGQYYKDSNSRCEDCERHYYQDMTGQDYCLPCLLGRKTSSKGSNSSSSCYVDCLAGTELQANGSCKKCERGYYRSQADDNCLSCTLGMTTNGLGAETSTDCNIRICDAGNFRNATSNDCHPCPVGEYQSEDLHDSCKECPTDHTTDGEGKTHEDNCTFYCPPGREVLSAKSKTCRLCPRGTYHSNNENEILEPCKNCTAGNTTETTERTRADECSIQKCEAGQKLDDKGACEDCQVDSYQAEELPDSTTQCMPCTVGTGTMNPKSSKQDKCVVICSEGEQNDGSSCSSCPQGTWSNGNMTMRFEQCYNCAQDYTTVGMRSTHPDNCTQNTSCQMVRQDDKIGTDAEWLKSGITPFKSANTTIEYCEESCLENQRCIALHYKGNFCFIYYEISIIEDDTDSVVSEKKCSNTPRDCDPGYYISGSSCLPCGFGQYQPNRHQKMCLNCLTNQNTSTIASTSQSDCQIYCPKGQEGNVSCTMCPVNYIKPVAGISACAACEGNYSANADRDACSKIYCDRGFYNDNDNCAACPVGTYKDVRGNANSCMTCDSGFTTSGVASNAKTDCNVLYCVRGKFENTTSNQCEFCPKKTYKPTTGNEACTDCISNKTTSGIGSTSASDCSVEYCDPGEKRMISSNTCVKCTVGSYQPDSGQNTCMPCASGYTTAKPGEQSESDCFQICPVGFQFDSDNKICVGCMLGYYKDVEGNHANCVSCPVNKTTVSVNSTSVDACSIDDCQLGYRRKAGGCAECEKGKYQTKRSQPSCIDCPSTETTESTGSTKQEQCIKKCNDGMEYNYGTDACDNCPQGFRTIRPTTERCVQCPNGQTTSHAGDNICFDNLVTTPIPPPLTTMNLMLVFNVRFDCQNSDTVDNFKGLLRNKVIAQLTVLTVVYPLLCSSNTSCTNINSLVVIVDTCVLVSAGRRRAVADNRITFSVKVPDIRSVVTNPHSGLSRPTRSVLQEDLAVNGDQYNPLPSKFDSVSATVDDPTLQCPAGSVSNSVINKCDECPTGTMYDSNTKLCENCTKNTYQSSIGQTTCTACPGTVKKYTLAMGSKSSSDCVSDCVLTPTYCNTGTCNEDLYSVYCTCPDNFEGVRCQAKKVTESKTSAIIGGAVGLLILILIIIIVCSKLRSRNKSSNGSNSKKFTRNSDGDSDAPYIDPIYHNRAYQEPLPNIYPSSGVWSNNRRHHAPNAQYTDLNMRYVDSENEACYTSIEGLQEKPIYIDLNMRYVDSENEAVYTSLEDLQEKPI